MREADAISRAKRSEINADVLITMTSLENSILEN